MEENVLNLQIRPGSGVKMDTQVGTNEPQLNFVGSSSSSTPLLRKTHERYATFLSVFLIDLFATSGRSWSRIPSEFHHCRRSARLCLEDVHSLTIAERQECKTSFGTAEACMMLFGNIMPRVKEIKANGVAAIALMEDASAMTRVVVARCGFELDRCVNGPSGALAPPAQRSSAPAWQLQNIPSAVIASSLTAVPANISLFLSTPKHVSEKLMPYILNSNDISDSNSAHDVCDTVRAHTGAGAIVQMCTCSSSTFESQVACGQRPIGALHDEALLCWAELDA
ncbi:hypothetical protein EVG20_g10063 [Dentipellis fragilis]|uniref:Uncharacterized protein n=1 Tax=Dentipellis fragilis TaxID=205917 RepID=A0A4Y9XVW5_9AGAM|nr:hypothetical protein EVG20_g10063 [Dentipellis fragilis]